MLVGALLIIPVILATPSGAITCSAAKFSMGRDITDATAWPKRLLWLIALWGGSVLTLAAISLLFRLLMTAAGLKV
jgi:hypothetical protein